MEEFVPEFGPNGNMIYIESDWTHDFRFYNIQTPCRGICYEETKSTYVYIGNHESITEIIDSCIHESIHAGIRHYLTDSDDYPDKMEIDHEHHMMRFFMLANDIL